MYDLCPPRCLLLFFYVTFQRYFLIYYKLSQILAHTHISWSHDVHHTFTVASLFRTAVCLLSDAHGQTAAAHAGPLPFPCCSTLPSCETWTRLEESLGRPSVFVCLCLLSTVSMKGIPYLSGSVTATITPLSLPHALRSLHITSYTHTHTSSVLLYAKPIVNALTDSQLFRTC